MLTTRGNINIENKPRLIDICTIGIVESCNAYLKFFVTVPRIVI